MESEYMHAQLLIPVQLGILPLLPASGAEYLDFLWCPSQNPREQADTETMQTVQMIEQCVLQSVSTFLI